MWRWKYGWLDLHCVCTCVMRYPRPEQNRALQAICNEMLMSWIFTCFLANSFARFILFCHQMNYSQSFRSLRSRFLSSSITTIHLIIKILILAEDATLKPPKVQTSHYPNLINSYPSPLPRHCYLATAPPDSLSVPYVPPPDSKPAQKAPRNPHHRSKNSPHHPSCPHPPA